MESPALPESASRIFFHLKGNIENPNYDFNNIVIIDLAHRIFRGSF